MANSPPPSDLRETDSTDPTVELKWTRGQGPWWVHLLEEEGGTGRILELGASLVVGSGRAGVDLQVGDRAVSGRHCRIEATPSGVLITDLGSTNGILCGAGRVDRAVLTDGGAVMVGRTTLLVSALGAEDVELCGRPVPGLVGDSVSMRRLSHEIHRAARLRGAVLLQGESGTGKDVVARALHQLSGRSGDYVPINVGAIAETLVDAELFGHARGAFTGAVHSRIGAFEQAHRGTLFLDEVADLSAAGQVRLLRVVEDGLVRPVGGTQVVPVDVRLVSASCAPLPHRIDAGQFRLDLFHRLSTFVIELPPLRERRGDVVALSRSLLARYEGELGPRCLSPRAMLALVGHDWPGNVRELASVLYRAAARADGIEIGLEHLEFGAAGGLRVRSAAVTPAAATRTVAQHGGNISAAARALGVPRSTLRGWLSRDEFAATQPA